MRQSLNNRVLKEAVDQILKNAHLIDSIIGSNEHAKIKAVKREYSGADKGGKRYEVLDISRSDGPLYAVVVVTNGGKIDILCECKTYDKARQIAESLGDSYSSASREVDKNDNN